MRVHRISTRTLIPLVVCAVLGAGAVARGQALDAVSNLGPEWTEAATLIAGRSSHSATLLPDGRVLVAGGLVAGALHSGSAELYDPAAGWTLTGSLSVARSSHTATLLPSGQVLVAGGSNGIDAYGAGHGAEIYDPVTGTWRRTGSLDTGRQSHTATLLANGLVLVAGGRGLSMSSFAITSAELYDPASGTWTTTGRMTTARVAHTATRLPNGQVLVVGGGTLDLNYATQAELYDPVLGTWVATGSLATARARHTATLMPNGRVLVTGGWNADGALASAEVYDPVSGTWTRVQDLASARADHTATLLPGGLVLVAGGETSSFGHPATEEVYDPLLGTWQGTGALITGRSAHTATLLAGGQVLVAGGNGIGSAVVGTAELYGPPFVVPSRGPLSGGTGITITGARFVEGSGVTLGGVSATGVVVIDSTTITVTTPAHVAGPVDVVVTNPGGGSKTLPRAFIYGDPGVIWVTPTPVAYGTPLSATQLNAEAPVSGTFVYTPAAGTVLPAGTHTLSMTFTPTDTSNYVPATATVSLAVRPTLTVVPEVLAFSGTNTNGVLDPLTPPQSVTVLVGGGGLTAWTAVADQPWVQVSPVAADGAGAGSGAFLVSIVNPGNVLGGVTRATATIAVTAPGAAKSPRAITVHLVLQPAGTTQPPFGLVDTPVQNATNLVGAIGVTGWAVDDVGIEGVRLYRNCLPFEPAVNCQVVAGIHVVFLGDATILRDARPDVEALYPTYPQANRAGWGYSMLTNLLPHVPNAEMFGGQGSLTLYARARDLEGKEAWLGRDFSPGSQTQSDGVPTLVTLGNDTIAKPFGAIDVPAQGATVSGTIMNFGWVLTPDSNAAVDTDDILMPTNGSSVWVWIDGTPRSPVLYNLCRGSAPGIVAPGTYCDDDVSSIFGHETPQLTFTPRIGNPTRHRNVDAGRGAIGAYVLDTTTLSNGQHTLVWGATDSAGRSEGIGSRYITVLNVGVDPMPEGEGEAEAEARPARLREAASLDQQPVARQSVLGRTGFDVSAPLVEMPADESGVRHVAIPELGRLELRLGSVDAGYLVVNGERRDLPVGSQLDVTTGTLTWAPGVGFLGTYRLVFTQGDAELPVDITIRATRRMRMGEAEIRMHLDTPGEGEHLSGPTTIAGWALDPQADIGSGIDAVHVWAARRDAPGTQQFLGVATLGGAQSDAAAAFGVQFGTAGFSLTVEGLAPGDYNVTAYAWNRRTARWEDARTVVASVR